MTKTKMGHAVALVANPLDLYALGRQGNQITIVERRDNEALVMNLTPQKADRVWELLTSTHPNRDIGNIEFDTKKGPHTVRELIHTAPDGTLKSKLGLI